MLLDGGSDDNFRHPQVEKFLQLVVFQIPTFKVLVGNGNALQGKDLSIICRSQFNTLSLVWMYIFCKSWVLI